MSRIKQGGCHESHRSVVVGVVVVVILVLAQPAIAQTQVESFTTALDTSSGFYFHRTTYAFTIPTKPTGHPDQEVTLDIYYNSRNVCWRRGRGHTGPCTAGDSANPGGEFHDGPRHVVGLLEGFFAYS